MRVLVLVHRHHSLAGRSYVMEGLAEVWRLQGHEVTVARGPEEAVDADLAVNHVDLTVTPEDHAAVFRRYPRVINGRVLDISKRAHSRLLLRPGDPYDGPVIVKADRNSGGHEEARLALRGLLPGRAPMPVGEAIVLPSAADVDRAVWEHPDLVVERYEAEFEDGLFSSRLWMFMGDRDAGFRFFSPNPVVKGEHLVRRDFIDGVPDELRRRREELGFDFGTFDYGIVDDQVVLYDTNRTPAMRRLISPERRLERIRFLADGLRAFASPGSR